MKRNFTSPMGPVLTLEEIIDHFAICFLVLPFVSRSIVEWRARVAARCRPGTPIEDWLYEFGVQVSAKAQAEFSYQADKPGWIIDAFKTLHFSLPQWCFDDDFNSKALAHFVRWFELIVNKNVHITFRLHNTLCDTHSHTHTRTRTCTRTRTGKCTLQT
jgi:hypothetical protein